LKGKNQQGLPGRKRQPQIVDMHMPRCAKIEDQHKPMMGAILKCLLLQKLNAAPGKKQNMGRRGQRQPADTRKIVRRVVQPS
jgi:hypothetical protein